MHISAEKWYRFYSVAWEKKLDCHWIVGCFIEADDTAEAKKSGPDSELEYRLKKLRQLPRSQQKTVIAMLDGLLSNLEK